MTQLLTSENFDENVIENNQPVLVDFFADWCNPCSKAAPIIEKLSEEFTKIHFYKLNIDESPDIAARFGVMSIPTFIIFKNGREIDRMIGLYSVNEFRGILKKIS